jgi:hypothetical protein
MIFNLIILVMYTSAVKYCPRLERKCAVEAYHQKDGVKYGFAKKTSFKETIGAAVTHKDILSVSAAEKNERVTVWGDSRAEQTDLWDIPRHSMDVISTVAKSGLGGILMLSTIMSEITIAQVNVEYHGVNINNNIVVYMTDGRVGGTVYLYPELAASFDRIVRALSSKYERMSINQIQKGANLCTGETVFVLLHWSENSFTDALGKREAGMPDDKGFLEVVHAYGDFTTGTKEDKDWYGSRSYMCFNTKREKHPVLWHIYRSTGANGQASKGMMDPKVWKTTTMNLANVMKTWNTCAKPNEYNELKKIDCAKETNCMYFDTTNVEGCYPRDGVDLTHGSTAIRKIFDEYTNKANCDGIIPVRENVSYVVKNYPVAYQKGCLKMIHEEYADLTFGTSPKEICGEGRPEDVAGRRRRSGFCFIVCFGMPGDSSVSANDVNNQIEKVNDRIDHDEAAIHYSREAIKKISYATTTNANEISALSRELKIEEKNRFDEITDLERINMKSAARVSGNRLNTLIMDENIRRINDALGIRKERLYSLYNSGFRSSIEGDGCVTDESQNVTLNIKREVVTVYKNKTYDQINDYVKTMDIEDIGGHTQGSIYAMIGGTLGVVVLLMVVALIIKCCNSNNFD